MVMQPDGRIIAGGSFLPLQSNSIVRLNPDGSRDASFNTIVGYSAGSVQLDPSGKILIAGAFSSVNGIPRPGVARLNPDGTLDESFNPGSILSLPYKTGVRSMKLQPDGKVLIGGALTNVAGFKRSGIARLDSTGALDESFNVDLGTNSLVRHLALLDDGKMYIAGSFTNVNGINCDRIARLNPDGSLDTSFSPSLEVGDDWVGPLALQPDGKLVVVCQLGIVRLNSDGSADASFGASTLLSSGIIYAITLQRDGRMIVGGSFTTNSGVAYNGILRLNADGSIDNNFNPGAGPSSTYVVHSYVTSSLIQPDGKIIVGGDFLAFNGVTRNHIARLDGDPYLNVAMQGDQAVFYWPTSYVNFNLQSTTNLMSSDGWSNVPGVPAPADESYFVTNNIDGGTRFYRLNR